MIAQQWTLAHTIITLILALLALAIAIRPPRNEEQWRLAMAGLLWLAAAVAIELWLIYHSFGWVEKVVAAALLLVLCFGTWYLLTKIKYPPALPSDIRAIELDRPNGEEWLEEKLEEKLKKSGAIEIDAMGVKLETVLKAISILKDTVGLLEGRQVSLRILILKAGSVGVTTRALMEKKKTVHGGVQRLREDWACLMRDWQQNAFRTLEVREFEFSPPVFLMRVGEHMLVNPYLATMGYNTMTMLLKSPKSNEKDGIFKQYQSFFDRVWHESSGLSAALPAAAPEPDAPADDG